MGCEERQVLEMLLQDIQSSVLILIRLKMVRQETISGISVRLFEDVVRNSGEHKFGKAHLNYSKENKYSLFDFRSLEEIRSTESANLEVFISHPFKRLHTLRWLALVPLV